MSDNVWDDDIAYAFSIHRTFMQILGMWPLQKRTMFTIIQWTLVTLIQFSPFIFLYMELTGNNHDTDANTEVIIYLTCALALNLKYLCINVNGRKLAKNINSAIADWSSAKNDEESYRFMKKHATNSRMCTLFMLYSAYICGFLYILAIILIQLKDTFLRDQMVDISNGNISTKDRMFLIPSGELGDIITISQYTMIMIIQTFEVFMICTMQSVTDSFYINVTLHLTGQLKVLKTKFKIFTSKSDSQKNYRKQLINLINRHCELTELNQNIEDSFHLIILFQLVIVTVILALLGLRIIVCFRNSDYIDLTKGVVLMNYLLMESAVYCYGADFVQKGSESLFQAIFMTSWFKLPATLIKDLNFAMMRSSYPFRLTGGKFFCANRETMLYVLRTVASYVSVLRVALKD